METNIDNVYNIKVEFRKYYAIVYKTYSEKYPLNTLDVR